MDFGPSEALTQVINHMFLIAVRLFYENHSDDGTRCSEVKYEIFRIIRGSAVMTHVSIHI